MPSNRSANRIFRKICAISRVLNAVSFVGLISALIYEFVSNYDSINRLFASNLEIYIFVGIILMLAASAVANIMLCNTSVRLVNTTEALEDSYTDLDRLNCDLRKQRHDFLNNLQVIYGLISMDCYEDAGDYIGRLYDDIHRLGRILKTDSPAINALLNAKMNRCEELGIPFVLDLTSTFKDDMPMPEWLVCRLLGNLIDNAIYAVQKLGEGEIRITLSENLTAHFLTVSDSGIPMPDVSEETLFQPGFTTKGADGTGMGLSICRDLVSRYNGTISLEKEGRFKVFTVTIPKVI